ncbi:MAG: hypothetical protein AB7O73_00895 [Bacteroidia bacterium]
MPSAVILFKFDFLKVSIVAISGGIFGTIMFSSFSAKIIEWWERYKNASNKLSKKRTFTKTNRRIIKLKNSFGLVGISLLSVLLLSIPLGSFLGVRFYKDKWKVILFMSGAVIIWNFVLYLVFFFFYDKLKGWLI